MKNQRRDRRVRREVTRKCRRLSNKQTKNFESRTVNFERALLKVTSCDVRTESERGCEHGAIVAGAQQHPQRASSASKGSQEVISTWMSQIHTSGNVRTGRTFRTLSLIVACPGMTSAVNPQIAHVTRIANTPCRSTIGQYCTSLHPYGGTCEASRSVSTSFHCIPNKPTAY